MSVSSNSPDELAGFLVSGRKDDVIYRVGDSSSHVFFVERGTIELVGNMPRGVAIVEPGGFFGERALYDQSVRDHHARALTSYALIRIDPLTFAGVLKQRPEIGVAMLEQVAAAASAPTPSSAGMPETPAAQTPRSEKRSATPASPASREVRALRPDVVQRPGDPSPWTRPAPVPAPAPTGSLLHLASGTRFALVPGTDAVVGRRDKVTGFIPDVDLTDIDTERAVGRQHLSLRWRGGRCFAVEDKPSANGSFVNGARLNPGEPVELAGGDKIQLGVVDLLFELG
jgi:predicted component of type VI protein secretion system